MPWDAPVMMATSDDVLILFSPESLMALTLPVGPACPLASDPARPGSAGGCELGEDGLGCGLGRRGVLAGDEVAVDDDVRVPDRAGHEGGTLLGQAGLEQPGSLVGEAGLGLLLVEEGGDPTTGDKPLAVAGRADEAGRAMAQGGEDLAGIVQHRL